MRLLLVEDDDAAALAILWALTDAGYEVHVVDVPRQAVGAVAHVRPDAVIFDISLGDIDGVTLSGYVRELWPRLPIVLASGHMDYPGLREAMAHPKTAFLQKPFAIDDLVAAVRALAAK